LALLAQLAKADGGRDGAVGVMQALAQAGVRPRVAASETTSAREPTAWQALAQSVQQSNAAAQHPAAVPLPAMVDASLQLAAREQLSETMFKPQALADYDVVIPVPMHVHQQPTPARFAIAERQTASGKATFVRVDTELTALGPLSVRLAGIEGGALSITIFAHGIAQQTLAEGMPDLAQSLRELGLTAGIRVADWAESNA
jgi:hypothetical protein